MRGPEPHLGWVPEDKPNSLMIVEYVLALFYFSPSYNQYLLRQG